MPTANEAQILVANTWNIFCCGAPTPSAFWRPRSPLFGLCSAVLPFAFFLWLARFIFTPIVFHCYAVESLVGVSQSAAYVKLARSLHCFCFASGAVLELNPANEQLVKRFTRG